MRQTKIYLVIILIILASTMCYASSLDDGKKVIDEYYKYSMEKDIDAYSALFDQGYLTKIYGQNYKELFEEIFTYLEIKDYNIDYQYYTESNESMTIFFNLKSETVIEGETIDMDNDMVAFFTKSEIPKLRYILLQEEFIGHMNREFVYKTAVLKIMTKETDLKELAKEEGMDLEDYKSLFKEKIGEHEKKHSSNKLFWIVLIVILLFVAYRFAIKK